MKKRILRKLSEEELFHLFLGNFKELQSLRRNRLWESSAFSAEIKLQNSVAFVSLQYFAHPLHSFLSIRGLI